jgi:hypothetical protein
VQGKNKERMPDRFQHLNELKCTPRFPTIEILKVLIQPLYPILYLMSYSNSNETEVFVYTGEGGADVPQDVARVRVDSSVTSIPASAFDRRKKLTEVELSEGLVEIGDQSFGDCYHSITTINIPNSLRRINVGAFLRSLRCPIRLHDGIERIGASAFYGCIFTNFRVPPLITVIPHFMLCNCRSMLSLELPESTQEIKFSAFKDCHCLRNVAFPPNAVFGNEIFIQEGGGTISDFQLLFGSDGEIIHELQHRFDGLPIHSIVYYQSYNQGVLQILIAAIITRSDQRQILHSQLNPTGNNQDCIGMTPLHILACSSVHDLEVYRLIVEKYPTNLVTKDRWGALPLLYAFWGAAPAEIILFLVESYQSLYPGYEFNWTNMVETMGRCDTPKEQIENLLDVKQIHFPEQSIDWEHLLNGFAQFSNFNQSGLFPERMRFLFMCGMSERVGALPFKAWRDNVTQMILTADFQGYNNLAILREIQSKLDRFEDELPPLKEVTTLLELALWKMKMNEKIHQDMDTHSRKKIKTVESSTRQLCRVTCGADVVIGHVLPFLIAA